MVATSKLSQIAASPGNITTTGVLVGVDTSGPTDLLYTLAQLGISVTVSTSAPANPVAGQMWLNPATQLISVAEFPSYAWSVNLSAGAVVVSGGGLIATRNDGSYPNIVAPADAGARSVSLLPTTQKYLFAITTSMDLGGASGFGICDAQQTMGNGMFLGFPNPSRAIGYYVQSLSFYYFVNNASPLAGASPISNGLNYVAIDPVGKLMWVKPVGGNWNGNPANNPATGVGGVALPAALDITTSRVVAQFAVQNDAATIDPTAAGLGAVGGFTPLSQIVLWVPVTYENLSAVSAGWVNIKDFGAVGDGVSEDGPAFQEFTKAYQGASVVLYVPPGTYQSGSTTLGLWSGIKELTIIGYGATFGSGIDAFGGTNDKFATTNSALIQSCGAGTTQLTLVNIGDASKFTAGDWIMVGALDIQGAGYPPNLHFIEFVQVTSVTGSTVFLDNALFNGPYLSTYPYYNSSASGVNEGGPATIYNMTQMFPGTWDVDVYCYGVTFLASSQMPVFVRNLVYRDCRWPGLQSTNKPTPEGYKAVMFDNCLLEGGTDIEIDKNMERMTFRNCEIGGYYNSLLFQSSSVQQLIIDGCKIYNLQGTPKCTHITDSWIEMLTPGPRSNGIMESLFIENSYVGNMSFTGWGSSFNGAEPITNYTFSNGTFSKANAGSASYVPWACPGAKCVFESADGTYRSPPSFTVLAVRSDMPGVAGAGNIFIDTTLSSLPTWTQGTAPSASFLPTIMTYHPYGRVTIKNCRGIFSLLLNWQDNANTTKEGGTGFQYSQLMLTGDTSGATGNFNMHGEGTLTAININVIRAYTGANGSEALNCNGFQTYPGGTFAGTSGVAFSVDAKTVGLRSWANGSWAGSVGADSLPAITAGTWLWGYLEWFFNNSMAGDTLAQQPIVNIEVITDVGIIKYSLLEYGHTFIDS